MIRITLNLAMRTWYNRLLFKRGLLLSVLFLVMLTGIGGFMLINGSRELKHLKNEIKGLDEQMRVQLAGLSEKQLLQQWQRVEGINRILEQRRLQHWLRLLDDLEEVVPDGIAITRIDPDTKGQGLTLNGRSRGLADLELLLQNLGKTKRFAEPALVSHSMVSSAGQNSFLVQFVVTVRLVSP